MIKTRPATSADIKAYFKKSAPHTIRAWALEVDGHVEGIAGYYVAGGNAVVFSDVNEGVKKMTIWRAGLSFVKSLPLPAICEGTEKSKAFLERLGWVQVGDEMVFKMQAHGRLQK